MADLHNKSSRNYSDEELEILKKYYPIGGYEEVKKHIKNRSKKAIVAKANSLGLYTENKKEKYSNNEIKIIKKYYPTGGAKLVLEHLNGRTNEDSIRHMARKLGISGTTDYFSDYEDSIIMEHYPSNGYEKVLEFLPNRNKSSIQQRAMKLGVSYITYDKNFFEKIDNSIKAYWLGFMYTDGSVSTNNRWGIELGIKDIGHLNIFLKDLNSNIKIRTRKRKSRFEGYEDNIYESCSFTICNAKMYNDLVNCGVKRNKTESLEFPSTNILPKHLYPHFIRGLFDGDGSYVIRNVTQKYNDKVYNTKSISVSFVCHSEKFIKVLADILSDELFININVEKNRDLNLIRFQNKNDVLKFINYVLPQNKNYTILDRKKEKIDELKRYCLS